MTVDRRNLVRLLTAEAETRRNIDRMLALAADEAARIIRTLGKDRSVSSRVTVAQLQLVAAEIRTSQRKLWTNVAGETLLGRGRAYKQAQAALRDIDKIVAKALKNTPDRGAGFLSGVEERAAAVMRAAIARETLSSRQLSASVYRAEALTNGYVEEALRRGVGAGRTARDIALDVHRFIDPRTPGGAAYAARRLARTELANAYHAATRAGYQDNPFVAKVEWRLSGSHPKPDVCDQLASSGPYKTDGVPDKPHPHCLCTLVPVTVSDTQFLREYNRGNYRDFLRNTA